MRRILFYTDLHAKDQNPRSRTGSYRLDILAKLKEIVSLANSLKVHYLINGADTFDHKSSWRTSHELVGEMIDILSQFDGRRHFTTIGTHDVPTGRLDKLPKQPLGILEKAEVIRVISDSSDLIALDTDEVYLHFVPASYHLDKNPKNYSVSKSDCPSSVLVTVAHGMIVPPGRTFFGDFTDADTIQTDADLVLYGHPHTPDGIYRNKYGTIFVGPGSVARLGSYPYNLGRRPNVVLLEVEPGATPKFKTIELQSARPPEEVFADVIKEEADSNEMEARIEAFVDSIQSATLAEDRWGIEELKAELASMTSEDPTLQELAERILLEVS